MKKFHYWIALIMATLLIGCSGGEETAETADDNGPLPTLQGQLAQPQLPNSEPNQEEQGTGTRDVAAGLAEPKPTPFRLFSQEEIAAMRAESGGEEMRTPIVTNAPEAQAIQRTTTDPAPAEPTATPQASDERPANPQLSEGPTLQEIYAGLDTSRYALNPNEAVQRPTGGLVDRPFEEYRDHPYLHLFPALETHIDDVQARADESGDSHPKTFTHHLYNETGYIYRETENDVRAMKNYGIEQFLAHPWFDPMTGEELSRTEQRTMGVFEEYYRDVTDVTPPYFGKDSLREVLAETVGALLDQAKLPETTPAELVWKSDRDIQGRRPIPLTGELTNPDSLESYIKRPFVNLTSETRQPLLTRGAYTLPIAQWDFVDPDLPIVKVHVNVSDILPLETPDSRRDEYLGKMVLFEKTHYSVAFVIAFQNRWTSFDDPNRWAIRFGEDLQPFPDVESAPDDNLDIWQELLPCNKGNCFWEKKHGAFDPEMEEDWPNYWHSSDYMQHSLIGPVVLTVHDSTVLAAGTYSAVPRVNHWPAPGPILSKEQLTTPENPETTTIYDFIQMRPYLESPNPGFPLPGHVMANRETGPGTNIWEQYGLSPEWD